jgi:hypothetical protein
MFIVTAPGVKVERFVLLIDAARRAKQMAKYEGVPSATVWAGDRRVFTVTQAQAADAIVGRSRHG